MTKYLLVFTLLFLMISTSAFSQSRESCLIACPRALPTCVEGGHAASYLLGPVNECTLKDEVYCSQQALSQSAEFIADLQAQNEQLSAQVSAFRREILRLYRLLRIYRLTFR